MAHIIQKLSRIICIRILLLPGQADVQVFLSATRCVVL
jgi:hypothetical protein